MIGGISPIQLRPAGTEDPTGTFLSGGTAPAGGTAAETFAEALGQTAARTVDTLRQAEQVSLDALKGNVDTREVVDAVMSAQQALQAAVAIRDKIVSAYLEISRMSI
ncbi:MAG: flagellar hook-basal body protein FliE [Proteobacteria bacterium]|jgi:flagellar hook-basal body complex protein FliE|nr:MAG: flagellar hook-basal body protein FliE [Pseudomonadota bacterium]